MTVTVRLISAPLRLVMTPPVKVTLSGGAIADAPAVGLYLRGGGTWHLQDPDLTAIGALSSTGWLRRTAPDSWALSLTVPWSDISGTPTTLAGYGITDALTAAQIASGYQPLDADLTEIAALTTTAFGRDLLTETDAASTRLTLSVPSVSEVASGYQPLDSDLTALASDYYGASKVLTANSMQAATSAGLTLKSNNGTTGLTVGAGGGANVTTADGLIVSGLLQANAGLTVTGTTTIGGSTLSLAGNTSVSVFGASLIDDATNADARNTLGLGTIATQNANSVAITGGTIDGTSVGSTTPSSGAFTTLSASGNSTLARLTAAGTDPGSVAAGRVAIGGGVVRAAGNIHGSDIFANGTTIRVTNASPEPVEIYRNANLVAGNGLNFFRATGNLTAVKKTLAQVSTVVVSSTFGAESTYSRFDVLGGGSLVTDNLRVYHQDPGSVDSNKVYLGGGVLRAAGMVHSTGLTVSGNQVVGPRGAAIANPSGGATVDAEARIVLSNILSALRTHGLIAT
jgi:hypothetical protein